MNVRQIIGISVILGAYGLTWFFLLRSMRIVKIIDREGLRHASEIKARLRRKSAAGERENSHGSGRRDEPIAQGKTRNSNTKTP